MGWDQSRSGTHPKYRSPEHRMLRASLVEQIRRDGFVVCTAEVCVMGDRAITNPKGRDRDGLHLGHQDNGIDYAGPQHNACNVRDAAVRAQQRQTTKPTRLVL